MVLSQIFEVFSSGASCHSNELFTSVSCIFSIDYCKRGKKSNYVRHLISQFIILSCLLEFKQGEITAYFWQEEIQQTGLILETWHFLGYGDQMEGHLLIL